MPTKCWFLNGSILFFLSFSFSTFFLFKFKFKFKLDATFLFWMQGVQSHVNVMPMNWKWKTRNYSVLHSSTHQQKLIHLPAKLLLSFSYSFNSCSFHSQFSNSSFLFFLLQAVAFQMCNNQLNMHEYTFHRQQTHLWNVVSIVRCINTKMLCWTNVRRNFAFPSFCSIQTAVSSSANDSIFNGL